LHAAGRREEGERGIWTFYEAVTGGELARGRDNTFSNGKGKSSIGKAPESRRLRRTFCTPQGGGRKGNAAYGLFTKPSQEANSRGAVTTLFRTAKEKAP
jgi:hypothetical protein